MIEKAYSGNFDMVTCGVKMIYEDHEVAVDPGYLTDLIGKEAIKGQMYDFYPAACNKIYKKELFKDLKFKKGVAYEDVEFMCSVIESHMGPWNTHPYTKEEILPIPKDKYQNFVHMCDYLASRKFLDVKFENDEIID